jgi:hypothetical protein
MRLRSTVGRTALLAGSRCFRAPYFIPLEDALLEFDIVHGMRDELQAIFFEPYRDSFRFLTDWSDGGYSFGRTDLPSEGQIVHLCIHAPWRLAYRDLTAPAENFNRVLPARCALSRFGRRELQGVLRTRGAHEPGTGELDGDFLTGV